MENCNYCAEQFEPWVDKFGDYYTNICKDCSKTGAEGVAR